MSVKLRAKKLSDGRRSYYLDIFQDGKRNYEFLKIYSKQGDPDFKEKKLLVEKIRAKRELEIGSYEYGFIPRHRKNIDFIKFYEDFLAVYPGKDIRLVKYALEKFKIAIGKNNLPIKSLTSDVCEQYANFLKSPESGLRGETPYNYWTKFRKVIRKAIKEGIIIKNPTEDIIVRRTTKQLKKNVLTTEELQLIAQTPCGNQEVKRAFLFACFTGLGAAEIRNLTWSKILNNKLKIYREKTGEQVINDLHPVAIQLLGRQGIPNEKIFSLPTDTAVGKILKTWVKLAGIQKNISFYCGRHTFATQLLLNGANLKTVADCLGHTSTTHTVKYLNYVDALKTEAIGALPGIVLDET